MKHIPWILGSLVLAGCAEQTKPAEVKVAKAPSVEAETTAKATARPVDESGLREAKVGGFVFKVPADWEEKPPKNEFLLGEFTIPGEAGPARLTLSSARGGIEANLDRWRGQIQTGPKDQPARQSEIQFDGRAATLIELTGTYSDMFGGGSPNRNSKLLGVAVALGEADFFVKMTGPGETVSARRDEFLKFVESAHRESR